MSIGQIAEQDIISPIEFSVYKSEESLNRERKAAEEKIKDIYTVSDNITFNALRNLDIIIRHFENTSTGSTWQEINKSLLQKGYRLNREAIEYLVESENRSQAYNYLSEKIARTLDIGIYPESFNGSSIKVKRKGLIKDYFLFKLYALDEARDKIIDGYSDTAGKSAIADITDNILVVNIILDRETTEQMRQKARMEISLTAGKVLKNETIIRKGERVNEEHLQKLSSMQRSLKTSKLENNLQRVIFSGAGTFILLLLLLLIFFSLLVQYQGTIEITNNHVLLLLLLFLTLSWVTLVVNNILELSSLLIPISFFTFAVMKLFNRQVAFLFTVIQFLLVSILLNWNYNNPLLLSISSMSILVISTRNKINFRYLTMSVTLIVLFIVLTLGLSLNQITSLEEFFQRVLMGSISIIFSTLLAILLLPYLEKRFQIVTREQLQELLNLENPLLKRMSREIPGTYHHSLVVGNLAESAAEAIGANHLLARVGSYYHDLGKLINPRMFIENNAESNELHGDMQQLKAPTSLKIILLKGSD